MPDQPRPLWRSTSQPVPARLDESRWIVLADVVQVVGDRPANVKLRVVLEELEQLEHRLRIVLKGTQPWRPRQPRPGSLRNQPPYMDVRVTCPLPQPGERPLRIALEEDSDAVFRRKPLRQLVLRTHRRLKMISAELRDEEHVRKVGEHVHAGELDSLEFWSKRGDQGLNRTLVVLRQMTAKRLGDLPRTRGKLQLLVANERVGQESILIERGVDLFDHLGDPGRHLRPEGVLQRLSHDRALPPELGCE